MTLRISPVLGHAIVAAVTYCQYGALSMLDIGNMLNKEGPFMDAKASLNAKATNAVGLLLCHC